mmetsp:Transcript_9639/g.14165  ORF Transcript_9639/g.14165 Transcript_9639/m.14165 type:complete len:137 (-) Transcript_9639:352-762(-)
MSSLASEEGKRTEGLADFSIGVDQTTRTFTFLPVSSTRDEPFRRTDDMPTACLLRRKQSIDCKDPQKRKDSYECHDDTNYYAFSEVRFKPAEIKLKTVVFRFLSSNGHSGSASSFPFLWSVDPTLAGKFSKSMIDD